MRARRRSQNQKRVKRRRGVAIVAGWLVLLLVALSLVTWRQTRGVEMERALHGLESERALAEAEGLAAHRRIEELESRARIVRVARDRLGMRLPEDREIVFLPAVEAGTLAAAAVGGPR